MVGIGSRVKFNDKENYYPQFKDKTGTVKYTSERIEGLWYHVQFDFRPDMILPCAENELKEIDND